MLPSRGPKVDEEYGRAFVLPKNSNTKPVKLGFGSLGIEAAEGMPISVTELDELDTSAWAEIIARADKLYGADVVDARFLYVFVLREILSKYLPKKQLAEVLAGIYAFCPMPETAARNLRKFRGNETRTVDFDTRKEGFKRLFSKYLDNPRVRKLYEEMPKRAVAP